MDATQHEPEAFAKAGTLGAVLYADPSQTVVAEQDWVRLVQHVAAGDELALRALYDRTHRIVFTLIMRITRDRETAEELTLDVFHDIWRRAPSYDAAGGTVIGWIMNQARSRAIDRLRFEQRQKRVNPYPGHEAAAVVEVDAHESVVATHRGRALRAALALLTADERRAIETAFFAELTHSESAERLGEPLGTVKTRIRSGLTKLKAALAGGVEEL